jgi:hypothetical protein
LAVADLDGDGKPDVAGISVELAGAFWGGGPPRVTVLLHAP